MINCPFCGKLTDPKLDNCPHCGGPTQGKVGVARPPKPGAAVQKCPSCAATVQDGDIICVRCGTNLLTGHKLAEEKPVAPPPKRRRWPLYLATLLGIAVILALVFLVMLALRNPVAQARQLNAQGNTLEAIEVLQQHLDKNPEDAEAHVLLGLLYWNSNQYPGAVRSLDEAARLDPANEEHAKLLVLALHRVGETERPRQIEALRRILEHHPENQEAAYLLALVLGQSKDYAAQSDVLQKVVAENAAAEPRQVLAIGAALQGNTAAADAQLREAAQAAPTDGDVSTALGFVASMEGRTDEAAAQLSKAIEQGTSTGAVAHTRLGMLFMAQGKYAEALAQFNAALKLPDAPGSTGFFQALCLQASGDEAGATVTFETLSNGNGPYAQEASSQLAANAIRQKNVPLAQEALRRAAAGGEPTARIRTLEGQLQAMQGALPEAQDAFRQAITLDPSYPAARLENGLLFIQRGVLAEGLRELEQYLTLVPDASGNPRRNEIELLVNQLRQTVGNS